MSVVINEFEAVAEAAPTAPAGGAGSSGAERAIKPHDLARPSHQIARRHARIWAH